MGIVVNVVMELRQVGDPAVGGARLKGTDVCLVLSLEFRQAMAEEVGAI